jgi:hypothetical protein
MPRAGPGPVPASESDSDRQRDVPPDSAQGVRVGVGSNRVKPDRVLNHCRRPGHITRQDQENVKRARIGPNHGGSGFKFNKSPARQAQWHVGAAGPGAAAAGRKTHK